MSKVEQGGGGHSSNQRPHELPFLYRHAGVGPVVRVAEVGVNVRLRFDQLALLVVPTAEVTITSDYVK